MNAKRFVVAVALLTAAAPVTAPATAANVICGSYEGRTVCTPIRRTGPARPTTHRSMVARATPKTVEVGDSVALWMGPKRGQNGFTSGELVRFFDIYKGKTREMTGIRDAIKGGIARWSREYLSLPGVDPTGVHHLCAMGERSGKIACVKVRVVWGSGDAADDDSYGGVGGDTNVTPPATTPPSSSSTIAGGYGPPIAG